MPFGEARTLGFNNQQIARLIVANTIINKHGIFFYSGTPAAGNLVVSIDADGTNDPFGNHVVAGGVVVYRNAPSSAVQFFANGMFGFTGSLAIGWTIGSAAITTSGNNWVLAANQGIDFPAIASPGQVLSAGIQFADLNGIMRVINGQSGDNNVYGMSRVLQQVSPRSQLFNSTTPASISGLLVAVAAGTYIVRCRLIIEWQSIAGIPQLRFAGPGINQFDVSFLSQQSGTNSNANNADTVSAGTVNGTGYNGNSIGITGAMTVAGIFFDVDIWGMFNFSASGTLALQASSSAASDSWNVISGFWEVMPV